MILVSNDVYRLGRAIGTGTRPRIDAGVLGVAVLGGLERGRGWRQWAATEFSVDSGDPVPAGVDGESLLLDAPLRFASRPGVLRVRIAPHHPGASPSAIQPDSVRETVRVLARMVAGDSPQVGSPDE